MSRCLVIIAEFATGIVRRVDSPAKRHLKGQGGEMSRVFESEVEALAFKDAVLRQFDDLEVVVRPENADRGGCRFYVDGGRQVADSFHPRL